jgi:glycosyltransferase involved in cell wall biosynthesis/SAM-dependent methyltransferase
MRIAILTTQCPFVIGGAELHARSLERALRQAGHEAEIVTMPFKWYPSTTILDHMLAARAMDVSEFNGVKIDLAVCLKFPAYFMQHPNKVYWILHQHRQAYDLWDSGHTDLFDDPDGRMVRDAIFEADNTEFAQARRIFANSENVAKRLKRYNGVTAEPLYHPPPLATRLRTGEFGDYFYYPSRISTAKRQDFVLRSLARSKSRAKVVFSGSPDNPAYGEELRRLAHDLGVADQVVWKGFVSDAEMIDLYAGSRGVLFTPIDEDLGYIALEAMIAGKPLVTLTDAGEPAALVRNGQEGFVTPPDHQAFAEALDQLTTAPSLARDLGAAGASRYASLEISWTHVVTKLTGQAPAAAGAVTPVQVDTGATSAVAAVETTSRSEAPAGPDSIPSLDRLASRFALGAHVDDHRAYYDSHWSRYRETMKALLQSGVRPRRILEVGTSPPYVFTTLLRDAFPDAHITVVQEEPAGLRWSHRIESMGSDAPVEIDVHGVNVETTALPFAEGSFDLIVAMEILEHFAIDPSHFFREAQRVLDDRGVLLVTTPNLVSYQGVARALRGASPYSFGVFVPWNGPYGRHNREYTPQEVEALGHYAGLQTASLATEDIYPGDEIPASLKDYLASENLPSTLRGQNIFYVGRKSESAVRAPFPDVLFPVDPALFSGVVELLRDPESAHAYSVRVTNTIPLTWRHRGPGAVCLSVDRRDQNGLVQLEAQKLLLPQDVPAGGSCSIALRAEVGLGLAGVWHEIGLFAQGMGSFKGAGRSRTVTLFAETLEPTGPAGEP